MGYGGFFGGIVKAIVRVAVTYVGFQLGGPFGAAVASTAFTKATGGSWKEALISGATAYVGAQIGVSMKAPVGEMSLSGQIAAGNAYGQGVSAGSALANAGHAVGDVVVVASQQGAAALGVQAGTVLSAGAAAEAAISGATSALAQSGITALGATPLPSWEEALEPVSGGFTEFIGENIVDPFKSATSSAFSVYNSVNEKVLGDLLPKFVADSSYAIPGVGGMLPPLGTTVGDVAAMGVGGLAAMTLESALLAEVPGLDQALVDEAGFTPQAVTALHNEARNSLSQQAYDRLISETANPFLREGQTPEQEQAAMDEFNKVMASGVERENVRLGETITEPQFRAVFDNPQIGTNILGEEQSLRRGSAGQEVSQAFPGDVFQTLDDDIISSIIEERRGPAEQQVSAFEARGNLNPLGGRTANMYLESQVPTARERISEIGSGVLGSARRDIGDVRARAEETIGGYQLGDDLFDVAPFSTERAGLIEERQGTLGADVREAIGPEPLFDVTGALQSAGRAQGMVSGTPSPSFLDQIAAREQAAGRDRTRRGLGSRGSGTF